LENKKKKKKKKKKINQEFTNKIKSKTVGRTSKREKKLKLYTKGRNRLHFKVGAEIKEERLKFCVEVVIASTNPETIYSYTYSFRSLFEQS